MPTDFKLPELGENIDGGDVVSVMVAEGDEVKKEQSIVELETDKATLEVPSGVAGRITKIHVAQGDRIKIGDLLISVESAGESDDDDTGKKGRGKKQKSAKKEKPAKKSSDEDQNGAQSAADSDEQSTTSPPQTAEPESHGADDLLPAGPAARRLARELGVDLQQVRGTARGGRITPDDVKAAAGQRGPQPSKSKAATETRKPAPQREREEPEIAEEERPSQELIRGEIVPSGSREMETAGPVRRERLSQIRRAIAKQMTRSVSTIPHVTNFDEADITDLDQLRRGVAPGTLGANIKLTFMPFAMKAVARALLENPILNSTLDEEAEEIVYHESVNLGIAVDTPRGLIVPVIRDVERMGIPELARALSSLAQRARDSQFSLADLRGGTFTISNLGAVGGQFSTPIINHPEVAILLLGRSKWQPAVVEDRVEPRLILPLSISYDHRLVDGAAAARFLNRLIEQFQAPAQLLFT